MGCEKKNNVTDTEKTHRNKFIPSECDISFIDCGICQRPARLLAFLQGILSVMGEI